MSNTNTPRAIIATALTTMALTASLFSAPANAAPVQDNPYAGSVSVPDRVGLRKNVLPRGVQLTYTSGDYANQPSAIGQYCDTTDNGATGLEARPLGGQQWAWSNADYSTSVSQVVTVWDDVDAAFADVANDTGYCRFGPLVNGAQTDATGHLIIPTGYSYVVTTKVDRSLVSVEAATLDMAIALSDAATAQVDKANI